MYDSLPNRNYLNPLNPSGCKLNLLIYSRVLTFSCASNRQTMAKVMFSGGVLNRELNIFRGLSAYDCARQTLMSSFHTYNFFLRRHHRYDKDFIHTGLCSIIAKKRKLSFYDENDKQVV